MYAKNYGSHGFKQYFVFKIRKLYVGCIKILFIWIISGVYNAIIYN